jgi:hypothetical protein
MDATDIFGQRVKPHFYVDIGRTIESRLEMLGRHESQRNWLRSHHHGIDDYVDAARRRCRNAGERASRAAGRNIEYAEGFRQHLGHAYPQENILARNLGGLVVPETAS